MVYNSFSKYRSIAAKIDQGKQKVAASGNMARNKFMQMDSKAQQADAEQGINTTHQNTITSVRPYKYTSKGVSHFSTSGVDGQLVIWDLLAAGISNLQL